MGPDNQSVEEDYEVTERVSRYTYSLLPENNPPGSTAWEVTVEERGHGLWAVMNMGNCLNAKAKWDYEPIPSSRTDAWLAKHRFPLEEARRLARQVAPSITWNGMTAVDLLAKVVHPSPFDNFDEMVEKGAAGRFYGRQTELTELYGVDSPYSKQNTTWELCDQTSKDAYRKQGCWRRCSVTEKSSTISPPIKQSVPYVRTAQWFGAHVVVQRLPEIRKLANKINADKTTSAERLVLLADLEKTLRQAAKMARYERVGLKAELKGQ